MSQTLAQRWNPYVELDITAHRSKEIHCTGLNLRNVRCGCTLQRDARQQVLRLLDDMSMRLPRDTLELLPQLAKVSLCEYHWRQVDGKVEEWTAIINEIVPDSGITKPRADSAQPSQSSYNTRATYSNGRDLVSELTDLQFKYDKVVEDVKALHDQNKELKEKLKEECRQVEELEARMVNLEVTTGTSANDVVTGQSEDRRSPRRTTQVQEESIFRNKRSKFFPRRNY